METSLLTIRPITPSTSEPKLEKFTLAQAHGGASTISSRRRSDIASVMTAISSKVAGTATLRTAAVLAPRIFGGARSISSCSAAAWSSERSNLYAAAFDASVFGCALQADTSSG